MIYPDLSEDILSNYNEDKVPPTGGIFYINYPWVKITITVPPLILLWLLPA